MASVACGPALKPARCITRIAGYFDIDAATNKHYFYWYASARSGATNKLILWLTGGPGCSSLLALLSENGPCLIDPSGTKTDFNPYGWNSNASVIWLDQPAGTGFSYADQSGYDTNSSQAGYDIYRFLQAFYKAHPQMLGAELFIAVESYGGHWGPAAAYAIYEGNSNLQPGDVYIPLAGLSIGNGLTNPLVQYQYYPYLAYNWTIYKKGTPDISLSEYEQMTAAMPECLSKIQACQDDVTVCADAQSFCDDAMFSPYLNNGWDFYDVTKQCAVPPLCTNMTPLTDFLNSATVQQTLGVNPPTVWQVCSDSVNGAFASDWMRRLDQLLVPLLQNGTRVLVYSGDDDFSVNWAGSNAWTMALQWNNQAGFNATALSDWHVGGAVAGAVRSFGGLTFLRVTDAGHMVPSDKPVPALALINTFIQNLPWS